MDEKPHTPYFEVKNPEGETFRVEIPTSRFTIGREAHNDLRLSDPLQLISRSHCLVEKKPGGWQVTDNGTVNGTFVRRAGRLEAVRGEQPLKSGETLCILGIFVDQEPPRYWELTFFDPAETNKAQLSVEPSFVYDWSEAKLYRIFGEKKEELPLRPTEHKFIRYMASRKRSNDGSPVLCAYEDLSEAVWGEQVGKDLVNHLASALRRKTEMSAKEPKLLEMQRGLGFRLLIPVLG